MSNPHTPKPTPEALRRRIPDIKTLAEVMKFKAPTLDFKKRRLQEAHTVWDLRSIAKRRTPKAPFDYTDGAADGEISITGARELFSKVQFVPSVLNDVTEVDLSVEVLGKRSTLPVGIAPTGFTRLMQSEGEYAGSSAAEAEGIPFSLSTLGTASPEDVAAHAPHARRWFQLYATRDKDRNASLIQRAADSGFDTLMLTVDTAVGGNRIRDLRNGMKMPPQLTLKTVLDASYRPAWWYNFLTHAPLEFASLSHFDGTVSELLTSTFDPGLSFDDVAWLREHWKGNLLVKGIQNVDDARRSMDAGADGVILSNHGGRQLDRAPIPLQLVAPTRKALGEKATIIMDTGIMHGADVLAAIAAGADFTLVGRAYLFALMAGGEAGVLRMLEILRGEMTRTLKLMGVTRVEDLTPDHVRIPN